MITAIIQEHHFAILMAMICDHDLSSKVVAVISPLSVGEVGMVGQSWCSVPWKLGYLTQLTPPPQFGSAFFPSSPKHVRLPSRHYSISKHLGSLTIFPFPFPFAPLPSPTTRNSQTGNLNPHTTLSSLLHRPTTSRAGRTQRQTSVSQSSLTAHRARGRRQTGVHKHCVARC